MDGASIPQEFWTFIRGPFEGKYRNASVCHDVACNERKHRWQDVHHMFYDGCGAARSRMQGLRRCFWAVWNFGPKWGDASGVPRDPASNRRHINPETEVDR